MAVITLRDIPDDLQEFLKADAAANHRSLNKQVITALDEYRALRLQQAAVKKTPAEKRAAAAKILASIRKNMILDSRSADEILGYNEHGLPS